nr:RNA-directed DNA polymerase, eukaryota [Tanacetum cinerariifolium]
MLSDLVLIGAVDDGLFRGLKINIQKSQVLGIGVPHSTVVQAADMIGLTLLKYVLGASPLYNMSIFKVPKGVLKAIEAIRCKFFYGADSFDKKITWVAWDKVLASRKNGGLGLSSFHAEVRDGAERLQWSDLISIVDSVFLSSSKDRWVCDLSGDGEFKVKVVLNFLDDMFLPSISVATRWLKCIPIKINIFAWRARRDSLPTRYDLSRRGVVVDSVLCPIRGAAVEDIQHVLFRCELAQSILRKNVESAKELWDSLESKYMADDASSRKFLCVEKLPPSRKAFKHSLKHGEDDMFLVQLGRHLRIEESLKAQESNNGKGKEADGPSVSIMEEGGKNKNNKQHKRKKHSFKDNGGSGSNKKLKLAC